MSLKVGRETAKIRWRTAYSCTPFPWTWTPPWTGHLADLSSSRSTRLPRRRSLPTASAVTHNFKSN
eukprot:6885267-Prymnesium_polylepis.1